MFLLLNKIKQIHIIKLLYWIIMGEKMNEVIVIGGGLAGTEAALQIAKRKIKVKLYSDYVTGEAVNLSDTGELIVKVKGDSIALNAGDIL